MACSDSPSGNTEFTCWVLHGEQIIPLCVSAKTQVKDLGSAICEATSLVKLENSEAGSSKTSHSVVLQIKQEDKAQSGDLRIAFVQAHDNGGSKASGEQDITTLEDCNVPNGSNITAIEEFSFNDSQHQSVQTDQEDNGVEAPRLSLTGFILYTYMWSTFQWIEPKEAASYSGKLPFVFYKIMRVLIALTLWAAVAFEIFNLTNGLTALLAATDTFTAVVAVMHRLLWTLRYVILHHLGLYFFQTHRGHINDVLNNSHRISRTCIVEEIAPANPGSYGSYSIFSSCLAFNAEVDPNFHRAR